MEAENRRVRMSKRLIKDALIELLSSQGLGEISVKEICDRADVNRSTFYAHYDGLPSLLRDVEEDFFKLLPVNYADSSDVLKALELFLEYVKKHEMMFTVLCKHDAHFEQMLFDKIKENYFKNIVGLRYKLPDNDSALFIRYVFSGSLSVVKDWIERKYYCPSRDLARFLLRLGEKLYAFLISNRL